MVAEIESGAEVRASPDALPAFAEWATENSVALADHARHGGAYRLRCPTLVRVWTDVHQRAHRPRSRGRMRGLRCEAASCRRRRGRPSPGDQGGRGRAAGRGRVSGGADARGSRVLHDAAFDRVVDLIESPPEPTALPRRLMTDQDTTAPEALPSGVSGDPNAEEKKRCPARPMTTTCIPGSLR